MDTNEHFREALRHVLDHYLDAEKDDYAATVGKRGPGHIYESLSQLARWMELTEPKAAGAEEVGDGQ